MMGYWKDNKVVATFWAFVALYVAVMLIYPRLAPNDDFVFLRTLQAGNPVWYYSDNFPYYDATAFGRFTPLVPMEYNFAWLFSSNPSPLWYYGFHALQFLALMWAALKLFKGAANSKYTPYAAATLLTLMPGFAIAFFRLQMNERNVLAYLALFLLAYSYYLIERRWQYAALSLFFANLAIYYKEVAFIPIGVFAFAHLVLSWRSSDKKTRVLDVALWLSSVLYLILYYVLVYSVKSRAYIPIFYNVYLVLAKNILNYALFSDPFIFVVALPLTLYRTYRIFVRRDIAHPYYDSMLAVIPVYIAAFLALKLYSPYYLLPTYIMALPPVLYFFSRINYGPVTYWIWRGLWATAGFFILTNSIPAGLHYITYQKYLGINFNKTLDVLEERVPKSPAAETKTNIFLDGVDIGTGRGTYFIFAEFLNYRGLGSDALDLKSNVLTPKPEPLAGKVNFPYTVFNSDAPSEVQSGDYLVVTPQRETNRGIAHLAELKKDYTLVLETKSPFAFPNVTLKSLIKFIASSLLSRDKTSNGLIVNETIIEDPDYYIFVKK